MLQHVGQAAVSLKQVVSNLSEMVINKYQNHLLYDIGIFIFLNENFVTKDKWLFIVKVVEIWNNNFENFKLEIKNTKVGHCGSKNLK